MKAGYSLTFYTSLMFVSLLGWAGISWSAGLEVQKITDQVYALVGDMDQRNAENLGNNSTHGFVILDDGVLLMDSGGSYLGAKAIAEKIKTVTNTPVKWVVNTGSQDHRWFGNGYFKQNGAQIYTSSRALKDQQAGCGQMLNMMKNLIDDSAIAGTECVYADQTFAEQHRLTLGGERFELIHAGPGHTQGDFYVWMPSSKIVFAGDIVFNDRALGIQYTKDVKGWIATFESIEALNPNWIIPGHGFAGNLAKAKKDTYDYLVFLRDEVSRIVEEGGSMTDAGEIDQSNFNYLQQLDTIGAKNALWIFETLEFE
jgi:glyoxylase-like metal-dependent hydrolase (beta-lactamase superfamily II)